MVRAEARPAAGGRGGGGAGGGVGAFSSFSFFLSSSTSSPLRPRRPGGQGGGPAAPTARAPRRGPAAPPLLTAAFTGILFFSGAWWGLNFPPGLVPGADFVAFRRRLSGCFSSLEADSELGAPWVRQSLVGSLVAVRGRMQLCPARAVGFEVSAACFSSRAALGC